jgi:ubiquitin-conjugating enzyme E2 I
MFHPNIFPSGTVCLSILNADKDYVPSLTIRSILSSIQDLLDHPNINDPAQKEAFTMLRDKPLDYEKSVKKLVAAYAAASEDD